LRNSRKLRNFVHFAFLEQEDRWRKSALTSIIMSTLQAKMMLGIEGDATRLVPFISRLKTGIRC